MTPLAMLLINIGIVNGEFRAGPFVTRICQLILQRFQAADSAADDYAETVALFQIVHIDSAVRDRHFRCGHGQVA